MCIDRTAMIHRSSLLRVCLWASVLAACGAPRADLLAQDPCASKPTCSDCIRTPNCAWCFEAEFSGTRCSNPAAEAGGTAGCDEAFILSPDNLLSVDPMYNMDLSRAKSRMGISSGSSSYEGSAGAKGRFAASGGGGAAGAGGRGGFVQIKPQRVKLNMRMNQMQKLTFAYSPAQDYPVDLYYLMGLSRSMKNDKEKLSALGSALSATMRNITSNFRIGFGSFVDNLKSSCDGCTASHRYRNHMSLSVDTDYFEEAVANAELADAPDAPQGRLDAMMQAVVCKQRVGWRDHARRLLVFSTDAELHYAGGGELGGIVQPNDGECHMENNSYTRSTLQQYPSISQINRKVKEHAINVIFAVTADQISAYEQLSKHIEGSSTGLLSNDTNNVVELVREQYNKIASTVEMEDTSGDAVQTVYYSSCPGGRGGGRAPTNRCDNLKVGDVVEFTAEITLKECPKDRSKWKQSFEIAPAGVPDGLLVELEMTCDCPCAQPGHPAYGDGSPVCGGGALACGVCQCQPDRFGEHCECHARAGVSADRGRGCRPPNATAGALCSGRGTCVCGVCECDAMEDPMQVVSGAFCECDNFSCDMNKGALCSGPERGACVCGRCACAPGYAGPACQCPTEHAPGPSDNLLSTTGLESTQRSSEQESTDGPLIVAHPTS